MIKYIFHCVALCLDNKREQKLGKKDSEIKQNDKNRDYSLKIPTGTNMPVVRGYLIRCKRKVLNIFFKMAHVTFLRKHETSEKQKSKSPGDNNTPSPCVYACRARNVSFPTLAAACAYTARGHSVIHPRPGKQCTYTWLLPTEPQRWSGKIKNKTVSYRRSSTRRTSETILFLTLRLSATFYYCV